MKMLSIFKRKERFKNWEEASKYLGKSVVYCGVETPDIHGLLEGIILATSGDRVINGFLQIRGQLYDAHNCKPENKYLTKRDI